MMSKKSALEIIKRQVIFYFYQQLILTICLRVNSSAGPVPYDVCLSNANAHKKTLVDEGGFDGYEFK